MDNLRPFFALLYRYGGAVLPKRKLDNALSACAEEVREAIHMEEWVVPAPPAESWPCERTDCARVVVHAPEEWLAACTRDDALCETLTLAKKEVEQARLALDAVIEVVRRELRIDRPRAAPRPASRGEPPYLGEQGRKSPRDVFLVLRPSERELSMFLAAREHAPRPTLVLVPERGLLASDLEVAHAAGAKVEIDALAEALTAAGGKIHATRRLRPAAAPRPPEEVAGEAPVDGKVVFPIRAWEDLRLRAYKDGTILVTVGARSRRVTHVELGMANAKNRKPLRHYLLLLAVCAHHGEFRWKEFGSFETAKKLMSRLRRALSGAFGCDADPFHEFTYGRQWRSRFVASAGEDGTARVTGELSERRVGRAWAEVADTREESPPARATPRRGGD